MSRIRAAPTVTSAPPLPLGNIDAGDRRPTNGGSMVGWAALAGMAFDHPVTVLDGHGFGRPSRLDCRPAIRSGVRPGSSAARLVGTKRSLRYHSPMPQISTFLTFNTQAEDAARFYTSIFPNSKITRVTRYPDLGPQSPFTTGSVMTVEFTLDGRAFTALNAGACGQFTFTQGFSIAVVCETQQQVDEYWERFVAAGGTPVACGWITDHFGVSWQIDPKVLIELIADPDPIKAAKAMQAMMTMVKIDSEQVMRAAAR